MSRAWQTALVTGGNGFIGRHLVKQLVGLGISVTCLLRPGSRISNGLKTIDLDAFTPHCIERALQSHRFDMVFHMAAYGVTPTDRDPELLQLVNVDATAAIARITASWPAKALILAGSGSEYDFTGVAQPVYETHLLQTRNAYAASKTAGAVAATAASDGTRMSVVTARIFNVYGPGEAQHRLLPSLVRGFNGGFPIQLSEGNQIRDFLHVGDVVRAFTHIADAVVDLPRTCALNVASGHAVTVRQFCETAADVMNIPRAKLLFGKLSMRPDDTMYFSGNAGKLLALTGWSPRFSLADGIFDTVA